MGNTSLNGRITHIPHYVISNKFHWVRAVGAYPTVFPSARLRTVSHSMWYTCTSDNHLGVVFFCIINLFVHDTEYYTQLNIVFACKEFMIRNKDNVDQLLIPTEGLGHLPITQEMVPSMSTLRGSTVGLFYMQLIGYKHPISLLVCSP